MNNICEVCSHKVISHAQEVHGLPPLVATLAHIGLDVAESGGLGVCDMCGETANLIAEATEEEIDECQSTKP